MTTGSLGLDLRGGSYALSVNANIIDKPATAGSVNYAKNWSPVNLTPEGLIDALLKGHAISAQYRDSYRATKNFVCAGFIAADFDGTMTLAEAKINLFFRQHAAFLYTTASHTALSHRFRVVYLLSKPIELCDDWANALLGLAIRTGSDASIKDAGRMFFGNRGAEVHHFGATLCTSVLDELKSQGKDARAARAAPGLALPVNSSRKLEKSTLVKLAGGGTVRLNELAPRTSVHCPHHEDGKASAFAVPSSSGTGVGVHCMACGVTFWPSDLEDDYDFGGFDRLVEERLLNPNIGNVTGLGRFFPPDAQIERYQQAFLEPIAYEPGITLIKSPKGTGKTHALVAMLNQIRGGQYKAGITNSERVGSILLIGHRQTLIREAASKLGLRCYLDAPGGSGSLRTLAVCLDSLPKYNEAYAVGRNGHVPIFRRDPWFDLVIIDEIEQVLRHLLSDTLRQRAGMERCFDALEYEVSHAKAVVGLDADLGLVTAQAMQTLRPQDWQSRCRIIWNKPVLPKTKRATRLYKHSETLENEVIDAVRNGERCFVVSNSKKFIDAAFKMIRQECGEDVKMRAITSDNSRDPAEVDFIKNIINEFPKIQVLLGSPSIGTGIDITFAGGACLVDRVFGFFQPFINTHTDIDQQLSRVRNPGAVDVWISPGSFNFTSNVDVLKDDLARSYFVPRCVRGRSDDGMVDYNANDPLLMICSHLTALQRASKNRLAELFCQLREANGWRIEHVDTLDLTSPIEAAKASLRDDRTKLLCDAPTLSDSEYHELEIRISKGVNVSAYDRAAYEKGHFERVVGVPLDQQLVELNIDGRLIERIKALADVIATLASDAHGIYEDALAEAAKPEARLATKEGHHLLAILIMAAGLATRHALRPDHMVTSDGLSLFGELCRKNRTLIEEKLNESLRADIATKPVRQLNRLLGRMGLSVDKVSLRKAKGTKIRSYALDKAELDRMLMLAKSYESVKNRKG